jgi:pimeloyl-ACP methyl ester carboxylesterase
MTTPAASHAPAAPRQFSFAAVCGTRVHYAFETAVDGEGSPLTLVCVHGFGGNLSTWNDIRPAILARHNLLRLDLRGFGYSDKPDDWRYDVTDQAELVGELVLRLGVRNAVLVGHSYGGAVALLAAHRLCAADPSLVAGVVAIDAAAFPVRFPFQVAVYRYPAAQWLTTTFLSAEWRIAFTLRRLFFERKQITRERIHQYAYFLDLPGSQTAFARVARSIDTADSGVVTSRLPDIRVPCLVLWGEHDTVIPRSHAELFGNALPHATVKLIAASGHAPQEEQPQATGTAILSFLESLP